MIGLDNLKTDVTESMDLASSEATLVAKAAKLMSEARTDDPNWPMAYEPGTKSKQPRKAKP